MNRHLENSVFTTVTGAHVAPARRGLVALRAVGLAVLVTAVTWAVVEVSFDSTWTYLGCAPTSGWALALLAGIFLLSLLRLRFPATALVGAAAVFGVWPATGSVLAMAAFHAAARVHPARRLRITLALAVLVDCAVALRASQYGWTITLAGHLTALLVGVGLPIGVQLLLGKADRLIAALRDRARFLEDNYRLAHSAARLQERSRIAQEMHDQLGHRLSLISLYAGALELSTATKVPAVADDARLIRGTVQTAMRELRATLGILRAADRQEAQLQPVDETGTRNDLTRLVEQSRSAHVRVELAWQGEDLTGVPLPVRRAAHRLVREALTNVHRHAPGGAATVVVERGTDRLRVEVTNDRPPSPASPADGNGLGLIGVQERVRLLGGVFEAGATPGGGFRVGAELPLTDDGSPGVLPAPPAGTRPEWATRRRKLSGTWGIDVVLAAGLVSVPALVSIVLNAASLVVPGHTPFDGSSDAVRVGMTRAEVTDLVGDGDPIARLAAKSVESPAPAGASCLYSVSSSDTGETIFRYCFQDDRLDAIDNFTID